MLDLLSAWLHRSDVNDDGRRKKRNQSRVSQAAVEKEVEKVVEKPVARW